jgi:hypothetical protein
MRYEAYAYAEKQILTGIDRQEFERMEKARRMCLFAMEVEEKFALLFDNFAMNLVLTVGPTSHLLRLQTDVSRAN